MKRRLLIAVAAAVVVLSAACNRAPQAPMAFGAAAWPGYDPLYLARDLGYFQGVNLRLEDDADLAATEQNFRNGKVQLAGLPLDRALLLRRDIPDLKIILLFSRGPGKRMDVLVTRDTVIGQYHPELQQLLLGWRKALDYIHSHPDKAAQSMAHHEGVAPQQYRILSQGVELYSFAEDQRDMIGEPLPVSSAIEAAQRDLLAQGKLSIGMDTSMLVDSTLLAESQK
jgi:ABC-type nitrate/sulfonate/bicarbonate transport system substrate-binding protein